MGFENLQELERGLNSIKSSITESNGQLCIQKIRYEEVYSISQTMGKISRNQVYSANIYFNNMLYAFNNSIEGISFAEKLSVEISADKEKDIIEEQYLGSSNWYIQSELKDVGNTINEIQSRIQYLNAQINSYEAAIINEKRNIAIDFKNRLDIAQERVNNADAAYRADPTSAWLKQEFDNACVERDNVRVEFYQYQHWL